MNINTFRNVCKIGGGRGMLAIDRIVLICMHHMKH